MIYIRIKLLYCILLTSFLSLADTQPSLNLRQKLEQLLQDAEYNDAYNEIHKQTQQLQGMILKDFRERDLFDTSSEEEFFRRTNILKEAPAPSIIAKVEQFSPISVTTMSSKLATTTAVPAKDISVASTSSEVPARVAGSIENLKSIILKFIQMLKK